MCTKGEPAPSSKKAQVRGDTNFSMSSLQIVLKNPPTPPPEEDEDDNPYRRKCVFWLLGETCEKGKYCPFDHDEHTIPIDSRLLKRALRKLQEREKLEYNFCRREAKKVFKENPLDPVQQKAHSILSTPRGRLISKARSSGLGLARSLSAGAGGIRDR